MRLNANLGGCCAELPWRIAAANDLLLERLRLLLQRQPMTLKELVEIGNI